METLETLSGQLAVWTDFFKKYSIDCDVSGLVLPPVGEGELLLVVPSIGPNAVCEMFKRAVEPFMVPFIAPSWSGDNKFEFSDLVPHHDRTAEHGPYAFVAKCHICDGTLLRGVRPDPRLTVIEAFMYYLILIDLYGERYFAAYDNAGSHGDYHRCTGSRSHGGGTPGFRWDFQDGKVCLDLS